MTNNQTITIISASPRSDSNTRKVAATYTQYAKNEHHNVKLLDLSRINPQILFHNQVMGNGDVEFDKIIFEYIQPATHFVFIFPEYNGSYPGLLKSFIDGIKPELFKAKKVALVGVATGRAGNLRGMDHFQSVMHHLGAFVMPINLPISSVHTLTNQDSIIDQATQNALSQHFNKFIQF